MQDIESLLKQDPVLLAFGVGVAALVLIAILFAVLRPRKSKPKPIPKAEIARPEPVLVPIYSPPPADAARRSHP